MFYENKKYGFFSTNQVGNWVGACLFADVCAVFFHRVEAQMQDFGFLLRPKPEEGKDGEVALRFGQVAG